MSSEERRVIDYFIVAGLPETLTPLHDLPQKPTQLKWPIVEVAVINRSQGDLAPEGFHVIEQTPGGQPANLNHGSVLAPEMYLCYKRGWNKPPIIDLGVMYSGKEKPKPGCHVLESTPYGKSANVNNTGGEKIYITYSRADDAADSDSLAVVDIQVILPNRNEKPPHAFCKIEKNLNRGMLGSDVFLCYKKSIVKNNSLNYEAGILFRYPAEEIPGFPFPNQVAMFCLPFGAAIESWPPGARHPLPIFSTFVLTGATGDKVYGAAVIFYEEYDQCHLNEEQALNLGLKYPKKRLMLHQNQSICILSRWPFFDTFRKFLLTLYRLSVSGPQALPLERHIGHFMSEVPFPTRERPRILVQLSTESVTLLLPEETPLPKSGASFTKMLMNLGPDNIISLLLCVLTEHRILIHSLRPDLLTSISEAVVSMIFPFRWQCPYIPLCPLQLSVVLDSPTPFIIGLDSRYFDMFDPPPDITFVDIDTCTITVYNERGSHNALSMPKRPVRSLRASLEELYEQFLGDSSHPSTPDELDRHGVLSTHAFKGRRKLEMLELSIQEAFLRFMAGLLKDYDKYLLPVERLPRDSHIADSLFNIQGFINSREKSSRTFFHQMLRTQYFSRFIDERSFVSDENVGLAFFDDCIHKLETEDDTAVLLEFDETSALSERTVFVLPPEQIGLPSDMMFSYKGFSELKPELFTHQTQTADATPRVNNSSSSGAAISSILRRTKQEIKSFQKVLTQLADQSELMAKCFLWISYSLWFICLPFHIQTVPSKVKLLEEALQVLRQMHQLQMQPFDEVCYRILMNLCCVYNRPAFAIKIFHEMKQSHIHPNAITYGFYNKAVVESKWTSSMTSSTRSWTKLRNVVSATIRFRLFCVAEKLKKGVSGTNLKQAYNEEPLDCADCGVHNNSVSVADFNSAHDPQLPSENSSDKSVAESPSRAIPMLIPVTDNDPLEFFVKADEDNESSDSDLSKQRERSKPDFLSKTCDSSTLDFLKNPNIGIDSGSSKSKSYDELIINQETERSSVKLRRRGSLRGEDKPTEDMDCHAKTLSRLDKLKSEESKKASLPRTGSIGSAWNSAVTLFNSTYQTLRDSLSTGSSGQNIDSVGDFCYYPGLLNPLEMDQRGWNADSDASKQGGTGRVRNRADDSFTTDSGASTGYDSIDSRRHDHGHGSVGGSSSICSIVADLCTQSKCPNCANLLHDEEIMAGWSLDESNLQTRCLCCGYNFLPMIHVNLRDFRHYTESVNEKLSFGSREDMAGNVVDLSQKPEVSNRNNSLENICNISSSSTCDSLDGNNVSGSSKNQSSVDLGHSRVNDGSNLTDVAEKLASVGINEKKSDCNFDSRHGGKEESLTVTYLSPLVLRKEVENLIEHHGEDCLSKPDFVNNHPIIFWNLAWFFRRLHLPSHLTGLISNSSVFRHDDNMSSDTDLASLPERSCDAVVRTFWDGNHTHSEYGIPMYVLRKYPEMVKPAGDEVMIFSEGFLEDILSCVSQNNIQSAIENVLSERKRIRRKGKILYRSIYYDILFLSLLVLGRKFNIDKYDSYYREACNDISPSFSARLMEADRPPRMATIFCRRYFGLLQL